MAQRPAQAPRAATDRQARDHAEVLRRGRWFQGLPDDLQEGLLRAAVVRRVGRGVAVYRCGDEPSGLYGIVSGRVRVVRPTESGKELLLTLLEAPSWLGVIGLLDRGQRDADVIAEASTTLVHIPQAAIESLLEASPAHWRHFGALLTGWVRLLFAQVESLMTDSLEARVARRLLVIAASYGEQPSANHQVISVRQAQLAAMIGISRQSLNVVLRDFVARDLVRLAYARVELRDLEGLRRVSQLDP